MSKKPIWELNLRVVGIIAVVSVILICGVGMATGQVSLIQDGEYYFMPTEESEDKSIDMYTDEIMLFVETADNQSAVITVRRSVAVDGAFSTTEPDSDDDCTPMMIKNRVQSHTAEEIITSEFVQSTNCQSGDLKLRISQIDIRQTPS